MKAYPLQATVTKALRRDAGIIAANGNYKRQGWRVRGGGEHPASIYPDLHDTINSERDARDAALLAENLAELGWTVTAEPDRVVVHKIPSKAKAQRAPEKKAVVSQAEQKRRTAAASQLVGAATILEMFDGNPTIIEYLYAQAQALRTTGSLQTEVAAKEPRLFHIWKITSHADKRVTSVLAENEADGLRKWAAKAGLSEAPQDHYATADESIGDDRG
ncbi:hypothetical protein [Mycobacteroides franklinii]|uniref:Uncharacterized protein n=1 Tax=Mycobacteroides franklinii TaxID=948102 RepID=A0A4R5P4Z9_9MYCO|nr:hypothetical protein [Mycobacteroides franklinii]ORA60966.1 hypothetical protein BST24_12410 [Mycobacteroides franklinii]TDH17982.1 hypothetical protein EJ571_24960 [Mycobacteroides franklinii]